MSILADVFVAVDDQKAADYDANPKSFANRQEFARITPLELSTLWAKVENSEWNVLRLREFKCVLNRKNERLIHRLPAAMTDKMAHLMPEEISNAAVKWASTAELSCSPEVLKPLVEGLARLAKVAQAGDQQMYLWNCI